MNMPRPWGSQTMDRPDSIVVAGLIRQLPVILYLALLILVHIQASMNGHNLIGSVDGIQRVQLVSKSIRLVKTAIKTMNKEFQHHRF